MYGDDSTEDVSRDTEWLFYQAHVKPLKESVEELQRLREWAATGRPLEGQSCNKIMETAQRQYEQAMDFVEEQDYELNDAQERFLETAENYIEELSE